MVLVPSTCGRQVMEVVTVTAVVVTATQIASTRCQLAVCQRMALFRGTLNLVLRHWPRRTAVEARRNDK